MDKVFYQFGRFGLILIILIFGIVQVTDSTLFNFNKKIFKLIILKAGGKS